MSEPVDVIRSITATLNGRDLLPLSSRIVVAEDMGSTFTRATIYIARDSRYEMQEALAGAPVNISIQPQNGPALQCKFVVHSAKPQMHEAGKGLFGTIDCVDEDFPKAASARIQKGWKQKNADDIIKEVHKEMGSGKPIEVSSGMKQATMTSGTGMPLEIIRNAGHRSNAKSRGHYFNTNKNGGTSNFKTMKDLTSQGPKRNFTYNAAGSANPNSLGDPSTVFDMQYQGSPVTAQKQTNAQGKRFNPQFGKFANNSKASTGLSTPGLGVKAGEPKVLFPVVNSIEQEKEKRHEDRDQQNLNEYTAKLRLLVPLSSDIHAGDIINLNSGSATYFSDASPNNAASGKWLVSSLMHVVELGGKGDTAGHTGRTLLHCIGKIS